MPTPMAYIFLTTLIILTSTQNICQSCVSQSGTNFTCNNFNCQGFTLTKSQYSANSTQILGSINCINNQTCYYSPNSPYVQNVYVYLFCNYTFPGCSSCTNGQTCSQCQAGYFSSVYNTELSLYNCTYCASFIGGCETCSNRQYCVQCSLDYVNVFGLCYTQGGSIVGNTTKPWNKNGSTPTQIITAVQLFLILAAIAVVGYLFCYKKGVKGKFTGEKYTVEHVEYQQTYPEPTPTENHQSV